MRAWLLAALLQHAAAEPVRVVGILKDAAAPDAAQHLYAFLRSASYGMVHVGRRARAEIDAVIKLDAPAPPELTRVAALFPWCALTQDASKAGRGAVASMRGVVAPVRGVVFQGSLLDAFERSASGPPCETVEGPCVSLYAHGAAKHISTRHTCDALCQDAGLNFVPQTEVQRHPARRTRRQSPRLDLLFLLRVPSFA